VTRLLGKNFYLSKRMKNAEEHIDVYLLLSFVMVIKPITVTCTGYLAG
jgi:hypothetical protein